MDSPQSESNAFSLLDERIRRWIWEQKWEVLRPSQEQAIPIILQGDADVIISAPTSAGKTEATFLPVLTRILRQDAPSVRVLYISPLKALINDQFGRLDALCEKLEIDVHRWHGDVSAAAKTRLLKSPSGVLLITPESLEALFMRHGRFVASVFSHLEYVVVDEVHSFIGNERGAQLRSLLSRLEALLEVRIPRVGLSATLAEPRLAAGFLRSGEASRASVVVESGGGAIKAQLRAFYRPAAEPNEIDAQSTPSAQRQTVEHLMKSMLGHHNLVFCNRKADVEVYADALSELCRERNIPDEFCAHHGNLSKEFREEAEERLRSREKPATCICTSTLEMGIDIGSMRSVGQIGPPPTVASLRQRLGRSGRRGEPSVLRMVIVEDEPTAKSNVLDRLHLRFLQATAALQLMAEGWCEPPLDCSLHLSTCVQQIMSVIVERGGASIPSLHNLLVRNGSFTSLSKDDFVALLKSMREKDLIRQMDDGLLLLGEKGERIASHYSFYAAFSTPDEYQLVADGKPIGTMPVSVPLRPGDPLLFAGRRWEIVEIDDVRKLILLKRSRGGRPPRFDGDGGHVHREVRKRMLYLLHELDAPRFLDEEARKMLGNARTTFREHGLDSSPVLGLPTQTLLFHWSGDKEASTLRLLLARRGLVVDPDPAVLVVDADKATTVSALEAIVNECKPSATELAELVKSKQRDKFDWVLGEELMNAEFAARDIDIDGALEIARSLTASEKEGEWMRNRMESVRTGQTPARLTKSLLITGEQCPKALWLTLHRAAERAALTDTARARMEAGRLIGTLARRRFSNGVLVPVWELSNEDAVLRTQSLIASGAEVIFEATFCVESFLARIDILRRNGDGWDLIEVKGTGSYDRSKHLADVAFQAFVVGQSGLRVGSAYLMHLNKEYVWAGGMWDLGELFSLTDVSFDVRAETNNIGLRARDYLQLWAIQDYPEANGGFPAIDPVIQSECRTCDFNDHCAPRVPSDHIFFLGLNHYRLRALKDRGITRVPEIPSDFLKEPRERLRFQAFVAGKAMVSEELKERLRQIKYPAHLIDFETLRPDLPILPGMSPFQRLAFQWSCHTLSGLPSEPGTEVAHSEYLHEERTNPHPEFARSLFEAVKEGGSILIYSQYEVGVIQEMASQGIPFANDLLEFVESRFVDLERIVGDCYADPRCGGRTSIKAVLPTVAPELSYKDLDIQDGDQAQTEYLAALAPTSKEVDRSRVFSALRKYCEMDTLAMVKVLEALARASRDNE